MIKSAKRAIYAILKEADVNDGVTNSVYRSREFVEFQTSNHG